MKKLKRGIALILFSMLASSAIGADPAAEPKASVAIYGYEVIASYPHDSEAFTQGLIFLNGQLYESTGQYGQSSLREVQLETGEPIRSLALDDTLFGEGLTAWKQNLIQLTWKAGKGFVYARESFKKKQEFDYPGEGWGLTHDGAQLIMSDGTSTLRFLNPDTFEETRRIEVKVGENPFPALNELEFIKGEIYANIWQTQVIAIISPTSGQVTGLVDLKGLLNDAERKQRIDVLNGIAYDEANDRLFVTGKWWPKLFQIKLVRRK